MTIVTTSIERRVPIPRNDSFKRYDNTERLHFQFGECGDDAVPFDDERRDWIARCEAEFDTEGSECDVEQERHTHRDPQEALDRSRVLREPGDPAVEVGAVIVGA